MLRVFVHSNCNNGFFCFSFKKGLHKWLVTSGNWFKISLWQWLVFSWNENDAALLPCPGKALQVPWIKNFCLAQVLYSTVQSRSQTLQNVEWAENPVLNWDSSYYYFSRIRKIYYSFLKIIRYDEVSIDHL